MQPHLEKSFQKLAESKYFYVNLNTEEVESTHILHRVFEWFKGFFGGIDCCNEKLASFYFLRTVTKLSQTTSFNSQTIRALEKVAKKLGLLSDEHPKTDQGQNYTHFLKETLQNPNEARNQAEAEMRAYYHANQQELNKYLTSEKIEKLITSIFLNKKVSEHMLATEHIIQDEETITDSPYYHQNPPPQSVNLTSKFKIISKQSIQEAGVGNSKQEPPYAELEPSLQKPDSKFGHEIKDLEANNSVIIDSGTSRIINSETTDSGGDTDSERNDSKINGSVNDSEAHDSEIKDTPISQTKEAETQDLKILKASKKVSLRKPVMPMESFSSRLSSYRGLISLAGIISIFALGRYFASSPSSHGNSNIQPFFGSAGTPYLPDSRLPFPERWFILSPHPDADLPVNATFGPPTNREAAYQSLPKFKGLPKRILHPIGEHTRLQEFGGLLSDHEEPPLVPEIFVHISDLPTDPQTPAINTEKEPPPPPSWNSQAKVVEQSKKTNTFFETFLATLTGASIGILAVGKLAINAWKKRKLSSETDSPPKLSEEIDAPSDGKLIPDEATTNWDLSEIDKLSDTELFLKISKSTTDLAKIIEFSPRFKKIQEILLQNEMAIKTKSEIDYLDWLNTNYQEVSREVKMAMLAAYINYNKVSLEDNMVQSEEDWAFLAPHLQYISLINVSAQSAEIVLSQAEEAREVYIGKTMFLGKINNKLPNCLPNCIKFECLNCPGLTKLPDLPQCIYLKCTGCTGLTRLPDLRKCTKLECFGCRSLTQLPELPNCTELNCSNCPGLTQMPELLNCTVLNCSNCPGLTQLPELLNCTKLYCPDCPYLAQLPDLSNCTLLYCSNCPGLTQLPKLLNCTKLYCSDCPYLAQLPDLSNCTVLYCSNCPGLTQLPDLSNCTELYCSNCPRLTRLRDLLNCTKLECAGCSSLTQLPDLPKCTILKCTGCTGLTRLPDLPQCIYLKCTGCTGLTRLPDLPLCLHLHCERCSSLILLPPLPVCRFLHCSDCVNLQNLPEIPRNAYIYSDNTPAGAFTKLIIDQEEFAENPKKILLRLGRGFLLQGKHFPNVYYNFNGKPSGAIDVGGVRRDCISSICESIFKGKGEGFLTLEEGIPARQEEEDTLFIQKGNDEKNAYRTLGKILALCYPKDTQFKSGPLFSEETYALIKKTPWIATLAQDGFEEWKIQQQIYFLNLPPCTYKLVNLQEESPKVEAKDLETLGFLIDPTGDKALPENYFKNLTCRKDLREILLHETRHNKRLLPIICLAAEMQNELGEAEWQTLQNMNQMELKERIEGVSVTAKKVKEKLEWNRTPTVSDNNFNTTKGFFNTWIDQSDVENLRLLVRAISSNNSLSQNSLKIEVFSGGPDTIPRAHTCSFTLDLSADYSSQEQFNEKLNLLLTEGMAGGGFQMA